MAKNFEAPLRFLSGRGMRVWDADHKVHLVTSEEHTTLHCRDVSQLDIDSCVGLMQAEIDNGKSHGEVSKTLKMFSDIDKGSCIMGDLKPGILWEFCEDPDYYDRWKDRLSWDVWCSPEFIASEFYAREKKRREKRRE